MLAITQFEVYVLDNGRWTIHARYGSDQRRAAVMDARTTEFTTGLPTKVVAETYFPEINESELVTAYISPKARALRESAKTLKRAGRSPGGPRQTAAAGGMKPRGGSRRGLGLRQYLMQGFVAAMLSLVAATVSTAVISWGMKRSIEAGLPISTGLSTAILTYGYAVFFFFFFLSLSRSRLPLHRLLSYLWQQAPEKQDKSADNVKDLAAEIAPKLRAKHPSAIAIAEAERALEDLKMMRGDPPPAPEIEVYDPPPLPQPEPEISPQLRELLTPETPAERKKREKREKRERQEQEAAEKQAAEAAKRAAAAQAAAALAPPAQPVVAQAAQTTATNAPFEPLPLERAVLRRFVADVVQPATAGTVPDDPVTRRGISLVIAGAAAALAETARTSAAGRLQLIEEALTNLGVNPASVATFLHQHDELVAASANATLVNLGRSALAKHLEGADVARILAVALAGWRTPFGQPAGPMPAAAAPAAGAHDAPAHDIYVLTELRMGSAFAVTPDGLPDTVAEAARDAAMGLHNSVVRSVLGTHHGHEVKHTGTGIFAQFKQAGAAIAAAIEIQRRFTAGYGAKLAVALVENTHHEDPLLMPNVVRHAQAVAAQAMDGEILAERQVQRAGQASGETQSYDGENDGAALVKIAAEAEAEEPALYEHMPANDFGAAPPPQTVNAP